MKEHTEKRKYIRIPRQDVLRYSEYSIPVKSKTEVFDSVIKNISEGGILFESKKKFNIGDFLKLELKLPYIKKLIPQFYKREDTNVGHDTIVIGMVVRVEMIKNELYDIGVCFRAIDDSEQWALKKYINKTNNYN